MIKIAFFDIDGTLLKMGCKEPTDKTVKALNSLHQNGILLCMATGRGYLSIPKFKDITFDVLLTFNGSYVMAGEKIIFRNPLNNNDKHQIIQNLNKMDRAVAISNEHFIVTNGTDDFTLTGFDSIDNIKLQVSFYDSDTYDTLIDDGVVQDINLSDSYTPFSISSVPGAVALDSSNGINAYYVGTTTGWDDTLVFVFYIENTTDKTCVAESDDFSINDFMQDDYGYGYLLPGTGTFMSIEANDDITSIDDVTNASIKFEVRDYDSYETFYSSDELTFISNN